MGRFLVLISIFLSLGARAAVPGNAPILTIAASGQQTQALSIPLSSLSGTGVNGVFSLYAWGGGATNNYFYPLYKNGTAYQVGGSTKAYCVNFSSGDTGGNHQWQLVSSTSAITIAMSALSGTALYEAGAASSYPHLSGATIGVPTANAGTWTFGSSTYAGVQLNGTSAFQIQLECIEI